MAHTTTGSARFSTRATVVAGIGLLLAVCSVQAQQVYRHVGADGRVTYSDKPADTATQGRTGATPAATASGSPLPYEVRQIATRYPVTLYTSDNCAPCNSARNLLLQRGVPFTERTVNSREDTEALQRISGEASLPFGSIGGQQLKGFSDAEWSQYLDAAGYTKTSQLPSGLRNAPPTALVAVKPAAPTAAAPATPAPAAAPRASESIAPRTNPAGIQF